MPELIVKPRYPKRTGKRYPKGQGPNPRCPPNTAPPDHKVLQPAEVSDMYAASLNPPEKT